jgi:AraC-like DNA-binding protein
MKSRKAPTMRSDNSRHLIAAARNRAAQTREKALRALRQLDAAGQPLTFEAVAGEAGVSRSWLYTQADLRAEIQRLRARRQPTPPAPLTPQRQQASQASLLRRLEAATDRLHRLEHENRDLREALAEALGSARADRITGRGRTVTRPGNQVPEIPATVDQATSEPPSKTPSTTQIRRSARR